MPEIPFYFQTNKNKEKDTMERNIEVLPLITSAFLRFTNNVFNVSLLQIFGLYLKINMKEKEKSFVFFTSVSLIKTLIYLDHGTQRRVKASSNFCDGVFL